MPLRKADRPILPALHAPNYTQRHRWTTLGEPLVRNLPPVFNDGGWKFISRTDVYPTGTNGWGCIEYGCRVCTFLGACLYRQTSAHSTPSTKFASRKVGVSTSRQRANRLLLLSYFYDSLCRKFSNAHEQRNFVTSHRSRLRLIIGER